MSDAESKGWLDDLKERRFFRFVISYLIAGWGIIQFTDWMVKRYAWSPNIVDLLIILLLALLPSVIIFTYFHGRPGKDRWHKVEKVFIPTNLILAVALTFFMFSGRNMSATADKIQIQTEEGETIERLVPKKEYVTRLSVFPFEVDKSISGESWLRTGLAHLLTADLEQDLYLFVPSQAFNKSKYDIRDASYQEDISFSMLRKIAEDSYSEQFTQGKISKEGDLYTLEISVFNSKDGSEITRGVFQSNSIFELIDNTSVGLLDDLLLDDVNRKGKKIDLPVSSIFTENVSAMKAFTEGYQLTFMDNDIDGGLEALKESVKTDPDFTLAYRYLASAYGRRNLNADAKRAIDKAMEGIESLPEHLQFAVRHKYYTINNKMDKALALLEMWQQLYPSNYYPYSASLNIYAQRNEFEEAKAIGEKAIEQGHGGEILLALANIASYQGEDEQSIEYFEAFAERYPERADETDELGNIYLRLGQADKARAHFEKMELLDPNNYQTLFNLAGVELHDANYQEAEALNDRSLRYANSASDSADVYLRQHYFYAQTGQMKKAIETIELRWKKLKSVRSVFEIGNEKLTYQYIITYLHGGFRERYEKLKEEYYNSIPDQTGLFHCIGEINYAIALDDSVKVNELMADCQKQFKSIMGEAGMHMMDGYQAMVNRQYEKSIEAFNLYFDIANINNESLRVQIFGELYNDAKEYDTSIDLLTRSIEKFPNYPHHHLYLARAYAGDGQTAKAKSAYQKAIDLWRLADPEFQLLREAKEELAEL
ncbi:MAG: tetratricopeptide repeat protein [Bacteroidetes bacterium]|nr:tetratricopeptide repeat protein [Bacteroidota bacterium]